MIRDFRYAWVRSLGLLICFSVCQNSPVSSLRILSCIVFLPSSSFALLFEEMAPMIYHWCLFFLSATPSYHMSLGHRGRQMPLQPHLQPVCRTPCFPSACFCAISPAEPCLHLLSRVCPCPLDFLIHHSVLCPCLGSQLRSTPILMVIFHSILHHFWSLGL